MDRHLRPARQLQDLIRREALSRRKFLRVAATAGVVGAGAVLLGGCSDDGKGSPTSTPGIVVDPPPETTTIRLGKNTFNPWAAPIHLAEQFLQAEGFTNVQYVDVVEFSYGSQLLAAGEVDLNLEPAPSLAVAADAGRPLVILAGVASSEFVLFGNDRVQSLRDLKGKRVWVLSGDAADASYALWAALLAYIGIKPSEVEYVVVSAAELGQQVFEGTRTPVPQSRFS